jgi:hypothetical protein
MVTMLDGDSLINPRKQGSLGIPHRHFCEQKRMYVFMQTLCYCYQIVSRTGTCRQVLVEITNMKFHENLFIRLSSCHVRQTDRRTGRQVASVHALQADTRVQEVWVRQVDRGIPQAFCCVYNALGQAVAPTVAPRVWVCRPVVQDFVVDPVAVPGHTIHDYILQILQRNRPARCKGRE